MRVALWVVLNSEVCDACPRIIDAGVERGWEFMGHNRSSSRPLNQVDPATGGEIMDHYLGSGATF